VVFVISRDKEIARYLLNSYGIKFYKGSCQRVGLGAPLELVEWFWKVFKLIGKLDVDIVLSVGSPGGSLASKLRRIPHLVFNDTESAASQRLFYKPCARAIFTPQCYKLDLGVKHIRYDGYHELSYLHPNYYTPDSSVLDMLGVKPEEKYTIIRFVRWGATHDIGHSGLSAENKIKATQAFSKFGRVFITSEGKLPLELEKYRIKIPPERIHDALYYASLLYGESATMASECSILGTPAIYLDDEGRGYTDDQEKKYNSVYNFTESLEDQLESILKGVEILEMDDLKKRWAEKKKRILEDKIDVAKFIADKTEKYANEFLRM
jgi:predicted glycosyltransferase